MRFDNFDLAQPYGAIVLRGLGHEWDLHSFAAFQGITFEPQRNEVILEWRTSGTESNPWGSRGNTASGCRIRFRAVRSLSLGPRDSAYPPAEALCVAGISKVIPGEAEPLFKQSWAPDEQFHLRVTFQDERHVDIDAESATFETL